MLMILDSFSCHYVHVVAIYFFFGSVCCSYVDGTLNKYNPDAYRIALCFSISKLVQELKWSFDFDKGYG